MKAIRVHEFGDPEVLRSEDLPTPQVGPSEILVQVKAVGVNPVETYIRSGVYGKLPELPYTPGTDAAGVVITIGNDVKNHKPGDRVYVYGTSTGSYAEQLICREDQAWPLPEHVTFQQGAAIGVPYGVAYRALFHRGKAKQGETALIHGATGGVGIAAVQLARAAGLRVIGTAGTDAGINLVLEQGADYAVNHHDPNHLDQARSWNDGGLNLIIEMAANVNLADDLKALAEQGRVVVIGSRGTVEIDPRDLMTRDASVRGVLLFNASETELADIHAALAEGLNSGALHPVIDREFRLDEAPAAHRYLTEKTACGKIVLITGK